MDLSYDIPCLPTAATHLVLAYASSHEPDFDMQMFIPPVFAKPSNIDEHREDVVPYPPALPATLCTALAQVSPNWMYSIHEVQVEFARTVLEIDLNAGTQDDVDRLNTEVRRRGGRLQCLLLRSPHDLNKVAIDWSSLLSHCTNLLRLSLQLPLCSTHIVEILEAASTYCLRLESLQLPVRDGLRPLSCIRDSPLPPVPRQVQKMMKALYRALERWYKDGRRGGLRQLTVPQRYLHGQEGEHDDDDADEYLWFRDGQHGGLGQLRVPQRNFHRQEDEDNDGDEYLGYEELEQMVIRGLKFANDTNKFLRTVAEFCPNIEYLDGTDAGLVDDVIRCSTEIWYGSLSAWEEFCRRCTKLRRLNWYAVPWVDDFYRIFAKYPNPCLESLVIPTIDEESYVFLNGNVTGEYYANTEGEWKCTSEGIALIPQGCPGLHEFRIQYAPVSMVNGLEVRIDEVISDALLYAIVKHCKQLKVFEIICMEVCDHLPLNLTDDGISALATLESLHTIKLVESKCTAAGIFVLMEHAPTSGLSRSIQVNSDANGFLAEVLDVIVARGDVLAGRRLDVRINSTYSTKNTVGDLLPRIQAIATVAPHLEICMMACDDDELLDTTNHQFQCDRLWIRSIPTRPSKRRKHN